MIFGNAIEIRQNMFFDILRNTKKTGTGFVVNNYHSKYCKV